MDVSQIRGDLEAEQDALDEIVAPLTPDQWHLATPSPRWTIADQVGHLAFFDESAARAITDPDAFATDVAELTAAVAAGDEAADQLHLREFRAMPPGDLLGRWRAARARLAGAATMLSNDTRVAWYGPSMSAKSFLTARLMEVWAHGQDIADALGVERALTDRLRHIAQLGYITRGWSYQNRGLPVPNAPIRVELTAPSGDRWVFGPEDAGESVVGPAEDFCLVVVQRPHVDDTRLVTTRLGHDWLTKAQAFAGPPTDGPPRSAPESADDSTK